MKLNATQYPIVGQSSRTLMGQYPSAFGRRYSRFKDRCERSTLVGSPRGVHNAELYRGFSATRLRYVTPRHEQGSGFMADGYARVTGKPGVCFTIDGPGVTNILTAMAQAYADLIPMLIISSATDTRFLGMNDGRLHELPNQRNLVANVTAFSHTLLHAEQLPELIARAFAVFSCGLP